MTEEKLATVMATFLEWLPKEVKILGKLGNSLTGGIGICKWSNSLQMMEAMHKLNGKLIPGIEPVKFCSS